jgi:hypothetical protein
VIVAVLDTNVLVSAFPAQRGVPATLIDLWRQGFYRLVVSEAIQRVEKSRPTVAAGINVERGARIGTGFRLIAKRTAAS